RSPSKPRPQRKPPLTRSVWQLVSDLAPDAGSPDPGNMARLRGEVDDQLRAPTVIGNVQPIRDRWLGRKDGVVTRLLKEVATVPADQRRDRGALANDFKRHVGQRLGG